MKKITFLSWGLTAILSIVFSVLFAALPLFGPIISGFMLVNQMSDKIKEGYSTWLLVMNNKIKFFGLISLFAVFGISGLTITELLMFHYTWTSFSANLFCFMASFAFFSWRAIQFDKKMEARKNKTV